MRPLIELEVAKQNLHVYHDLDDDNLSRLLDQASIAVVDYLKVPLDTYEPAGSPLVTPEVPELVQAATMLVLRSLYDDATADPITKAVESLLRRSRDPALA